MPIRYIRAAEDVQSMCWRAVRDDGTIDAVHEDSPREMREALSALILWQNNVPSIEEQVRIFAWRDAGRRIAASSWGNP